MIERINEKSLTCVSGAASDGNQFELFGRRADLEVVAHDVAFFTAPVFHFHAQGVASLVRQQMKGLVA